MSWRIVFKNALQFVLLCIFCLSPGNIFPATLNLSWRPNREKDLAGYKIYYGTCSRDYTALIDVGNTTSYSLTNLKEGLTYYITLTAYDTAGNESSFTKEVSAKIEPPSESPQNGDDNQAENNSLQDQNSAGENGLQENTRTVSQFKRSSATGGLCFIQSLSSGTRLDRNLRYLRAFRDRYLMSSRAGRNLVSLYYEISPALIHFVRKHGKLRTLARKGLKPVLYLSRYIVQSSHRTTCIPC